MMKHEAIEWSYEEVCSPGSEALKSIKPPESHHLMGKTCIAWFKLADVLARGEKERTLSIYRLLIHSINHEALSAQLEGDILRAFQDPNAVQSYVKAAALYQKQNELTLAALLYETIIYLAPDVVDYRQTLFSLYQKIGYSDHALMVGRTLLEMLVARDMVFKAHELVRDAQLGGQAQGALHEMFVINVLTSGKLIERSLLNTNIAAACDLYQDHAPDRLTAFLAKLAGLDEQAQEYAISCVKK